RRRNLNCTTQRFIDDVLGRNRGAEQFCSDLGSGPATVVALASAGEGCARTDVQQLGVSASLAKTPHQHSNVSTLTPPVGMEFVQDQKLKVSKVGVGEHALRWTEHHVLQHHVVSKQ